MTTDYTTASESRVTVNQGSASYRLEAWREAIGATASIEIDPAIAESFMGEFRTRVVGPMLLVSISGDTYRFVRSREMADAIRRDNIFINVVTDGRIIGRSNGRAVTVDPGGVILSRQGETQDLQVIDANWLGIILPRPLIDTHVGWTRASEGRVFASGTVEAVMLGNLIGAMWQLNAPLSDRDTKRLVRMVTSTLRECLGTQAPQAAKGAKPKVQGLPEVRRYISEHLSDSELGPEMVSRALTLSRSSLYRIVSQSGGLQTMVLSMRLQAVHRDIESARFPDLRLSEIAQRRGVSELRSFRRTFVKTYGYTPSALRARIVQGQTLAGWPHAEAVADIERWFES